MRQLVLGDTIPRDRVEDRKIDLLVIGVEVDEEVVDLVDDLFWARVLAIDLVDDDHHRQLLFQGFRENVARLWKGPFRGVDQQHDPIRQLEHPLDLAAEVGVSWGIENIDLRPPIPD